MPAMSGRLFNMKSFPFEVSECLLVDSNLGQLDDDSLSIFVYVAHYSCLSIAFSTVFLVDADDV